jgi:two-component sensor histidine kinase
VTNSLKHAFPQKYDGKVYLDLSQDHDETIHLKVGDNGVGIPDELDWENTSSLGLRLVRILSKQLKATITLDFKQGTWVYLKFNQLQYKSRL